jgi:acyl-CoA thioester hydrolase
MEHTNHLAGFPVIVTLPVQWGDQDAFGHVNNVVYIRWCETSRVEYLKRVGLWGPGASGVASNGIGPILASIGCDYRRPVNHPDHIHIGGRVTKIGNSSFRMEHVIVSEALGVVAAEAHSTVVVLDYKRGKTVPVPDAVRAAIEELEGHAFPRAPK